MCSIDKLDEQIIDALNENGRRSFRDIARGLGVSIGTISNRIKVLEATGIIRGYLPVVDAEKVGYELSVVVGVKIARGRLIEVQKNIARDRRVFGVYDVTGEWDSILLARFRTRTDLNNFIKNLAAMENIERTCTYLVLNVVKEEHRVDV